MKKHLKSFAKWVADHIAKVIGGIIVGVVVALILRYLITPQIAASSDPFSPEGITIPDEPPRREQNSDSSVSAPRFNVYPKDETSYGWDESEFFKIGEGALEATHSNITCGDEIETLIARVYFHNGAPKAYNDYPGQPGISRSTRIQFDSPNLGSFRNTHTITAKIESENAVPPAIQDSVEISCDRPFAIVIARSAMYTSKDEWVATTTPAFGAPTFVDPEGGESGNWPACWEYVAFYYLQIELLYPTTGE